MPTVADTPQHERTSASSKRGSALIFLVDDEPMVLELAELVLKPLGYTIQKFRDPKVALDQFKLADPKPSLVITDYAMQTMNGLQLIDECRRLNPGQKVLLMSGTVTREVLQSHLAVPDAFMEKPFEIGEFAVTVGKLIP